MTRPARRRTAVLVSGRGSNMRALVADARDPGHAAEIALVASNDPTCEALVWAKAQGIAVAGLDHRIYASREDFDASMQRILEIHRIDLVCLAGFMRLLTPGFVNGWAGRLLNIHPALLPSYRGLHTHRRALADGAKIHGCTVHFVVPAMDEGPIVAQAAVPVLDDDTEDSLAARVLRQEHQLYPHALRLVAGGQIRVAGTRTRGGAAGEADAALINPPLA